MVSLLPSRRSRVLSVCIAVLVSQVVGSSPVLAAGPEWIRPVPGAVVRAFQEPLAVYAAGHRGVDFAAPAGSPVHAANAGVVSFAGTVAGSLHVVVSHGGGIRTSYSFVQRVDVRVGDRVARGQVVGAAGGTGDGHGSGVLHFGVRVGERYVDPMLLFEPDDLTQLVRLVPVDQRGAAELVDPERDGRDLLDWLRGERHDRDDSSCGDLIGGVASTLGIGDAADSACDGVGEVVERGLEILREAGSLVGELAEVAEPFLRAVVRRMDELGETLEQAVRGVAELALASAEAASDVVDVVVEAGIEAFRFVYGIGIQVFEWLFSCPQPDPVAHPKGSGNAVMVVGGQSSSRTRREDGSVSSSMHFEARVLGYHDGDTTYFSYEAHSETYTKHATFGDLHEKARLLGEQLRDAAAAQPGRRFDLVAHSQGGLVIDLFLAEVYRGHESEFPPIENIVTFASPHEGSSAAGLGHSAGTGLIGSAMAPVVEASSGIELDSEAMGQVASGSELTRNLWQDGGPPPEIRILSIMGSLDPWVPSVFGDIPGKQKISVPVGVALSPDDHSAILRDSDALSAAQAHLSGGSPRGSCGPLADVPGFAIAAAESATANLVTGPSPVGPLGAFGPGGVLAPEQLPTPLLLQEELG